MPAAHGLNKQHNDNNIIYFSLNYKKIPWLTGIRCFLRGKRHRAQLCKIENERNSWCVNEDFRTYFIIFPLCSFFLMKFRAKLSYKICRHSTAAQGKEVYGWGHFFEPTVIIELFFYYWLSSVRHVFSNRNKWCSFELSERISLLVHISSVFFHIRRPYR